MRTCPKCQRTYPDDADFCPRDGAALLLDTVAWADGTVVRGKYRILSKIGQGGMGAVYKALHLRFEEIRALKVMSRELATDPLFVKRFEHEAVTTRKLQHPNAVRVDDIDEAEDGRPFIVMEYIEGQSLKKVIQDEGPLAAQRVGAITKQVASALEGAHALGMVHRDIKPDNIVLVDTPAGEQAKVLDFGIAKVREAKAAGAGITLTGTGVVVGTPQYMSPEQAMGKRGDDLDARSDIYSLGIVMYQMLTRELPFKADSNMEMILAHMQTPPLPILTLRPELAIPRPIAELVMKCLEKKRDLRPASAKALIEEIERWEKSLAAPRETVAYPQRHEEARAQGSAGVETAPLEIKPTPLPPPNVETPQRGVSTSSPQSIPVQTRTVPGSSGWLPAALLAVLVMAGAGLGIWYFGEWNEPNRNTESPPAVSAPQPTTPAPNPENQPTQPPSTNTVSPEAQRAGGTSDRAERRKNAKAAITEGDSYYENGDYDNAIRAYQSGLKLDPSNAALRKALRRAQNAKAAEEKVNP